MNIKLNNDENSPEQLETDQQFASSSEDRRRTGRYVAIVVGISLVCLAMYHAWVRKVPVVASLLVPALIMFLYIAWVLYTASRDKRKGSNDSDVEAANVPEPQPENTNTTPRRPNSPKEFRRCYSIA